MNGICMPSNQASAGSRPTRGKYLTGYNLITSWKAMGYHPCEIFRHENYNGEDTLHSNRRRSESTKALEEVFICKPDSLNHNPKFLE